jgi:8-oxo-dGTP pyrophosphatase MutT (NUDIX family)
MKYRWGIFIVVYAIVRGKPQYRILKRKLHWKGWEFPKGGKRFYESEKMAVRREVKEETGLKILKIKKFNTSGKYRYAKKYSDRKDFIGQTYRLYAVKVKKGKVSLDVKEHADYKWVGLSEAVRKLKWKNQKKCLRSINENLTKI